MTLSTFNPREYIKKPDFRKWIYALAVLSFVVFVIMKQDAIANRLLCKKPADSDIISSAVDYFLNKRQPTVTMGRSSSGQLIENTHVPYKNPEELYSINPDCCKIAGLVDSEGPIYSSLEIVKYDIETTVQISYLLRTITENGFEFSQRKTNQIPLNYCGEVILAMATR